jgi:DNA-binding HxlR family transcriptional regulator
MNHLAAMNCSIARALAEVGERWSLLIVREAIMGSTRFEEFQGRLNIARNILSARLASLVGAGILSRTPTRPAARTYDYRLTRKGEDLFPVVVALLQWGDRWLDEGAGPPVVLLEASTGGPLKAVVTSYDQDVRSIALSDLGIAPGRGADARTLKRLKGSSPPQ